MFKRLLLLAATGIVLTGCYHIPKTPSSVSTPTPVSQTQSQSIEIKNFAFSPATLTVKPGVQIIVTNQDKVSHTLTADDGKSFDTGILSQGKSAVITAPAQAGSYSFHCAPHPYMKGTLVVKE